MSTKKMTKKLVQNFLITLIKVKKFRSMKKNLPLDIGKIGKIGAGALDHRAQLYVT